MRTDIARSGICVAGAAVRRNLTSVRLQALGQAPPSGTGNDEYAIEAVIVVTTDAFSRHDAKAWVPLTTLGVAVRFIRPEVALAHVTFECS